MELITYSKKVGPEKADLFFYPVLEDEDEIQKLIKSFKYQDEDVILARLERENFKGKTGQTFLIHRQGVAMVIVGTGEKEKLTMEDWRQAAGQLVGFLRKYSAKNIGIVVTSWLKGNRKLDQLGQALAEGIELANYKFDKYQQDDEDEIKIEIEKLIVYLTAKQRTKFKRGWKKGLLLAEGTKTGRDLVNEPAAVMTPSYLAEQAKLISQDNKAVKLQVLTASQVKKMGMHAYLGVAQGSDEDPKFIHLTYKPSGKVKDKIALVGKGITFDSGGLNIKTGDGMQQMKIDMGGAATVLGIFSVLADLKPKVEVHGIIAACENMPSGNALKPGDIVTNMQGKTIEIGNTDAEGRVTLADSLAYAQKQGVDTVVDFATLTGACLVALGTHYAAVFANDDELAQEFIQYSENSGEKLWHMPLPEEYKELNKSKVADIKNIPSSRYGGAITAALFLQKFIEDDVQWSHWDIAAPAFAEKAFNSYIPEGGVGFGVRTVLEWLLDK